MDSPPPKTPRDALLYVLILGWTFIILLVCGGKIRALLGPSLWAIRGVAGLSVITIVCVRRWKFLSEGFQAIGWLILTMLCLMAIAFGFDASSEARSFGKVWDPSEAPPAAASFAPESSSR